MSAIAIDDGVVVPALDRCATHLERAFRVFKSLHPQPMSARELAVRMYVEPSTAYEYVRRLKSEGCIEIKGGSRRIPLYGVVVGAMAPGDRRRTWSGFECLLPGGTEAMDGTPRIAPNAVYLLSPKIQSTAAVRAAVQFEDLAAKNPHHELFVLWFRQDLQNPFAIVLRLAKSRIARDGWPLIVDPETRVVAFEPPAD